MKIFLLVFSLLLVACGDDTSSASPEVGEGEGYVRFTLTGDRLAEPVVFEGVSESLKAMLASDLVAITARNTGISSEDEVYTFDQLTMSLPDKSLKTHTHGTFETTFSITGPFNEDGTRTTFSIKQSEMDSGTITTTEVGNRVRGTFNLVGNPTQLNGEGLEYRLEGEFNFARCEELFCF